MKIAIKNKQSFDKMFRIPNFDIVISPTFVSK